MDITTSVATHYGSWPTQHAELWQKQLEALKAKFAGAIEEVWMPGQEQTDVPIVFVQRTAVLDVLAYLKNEPGFDYQFLADLTATDEESDPRFEVVYQLLSHSSRARIRVKVRVAEGVEVPSATVVWPAANWAEREVWDMFGIKFSGHPDLRRILMDERWEGHPLRKDYPLRGYQLFPTPMEVDQSRLK
jgi:NADH-quinone oxidoreductase subunit C